jgi:hypothetical protein
MGFDPCESGPDGRIAPGAPIYSPFIRHRQNLVLA